MHEQLRNRALSWWADVVSSHPRWIQVIALGVSLLSIVVAALFLDFQGDRNDLLSKDIGWNRVFLDWTDQFPSRNDVLVVIDAKGAADASSAHSIADELAGRLADADHVAGVAWRFDALEFTPRAARLLPMEEYQERLASAARSRVLLRSPTMAGYLQQTAGALRAGREQGMTAEQGAQSLHQLAAWLAAMQEAAVTRPAEQGNPFMSVSGPLTPGDEHQWRYMTNAADDIYFIRVTPEPAENEINQYEPALASIREVVRAVDEEFSSVQVGMTGVRVLESEETAAATRDTTLASIFAAVSIAVLLILAFHGWRTPLLGMIALGCAIAWTFGITTLVIGHLQVLSVVFTLILLGLGIDYAVHLASHFELVRHQFPDTREGFAAALKSSFTVTGPGVVTGALTTAAAFGTTLFTSFKGVQEMGAIAAMGVLLCLLAMGSVLPALLRSYSRKHKHIKPHEDRMLRQTLTRFSTPFVRHAWLTMGVAFVLACVSGYAVTGMQFDFNLLKLHPKNAEGLAWMQLISRRTEQSIWYGVSQTDDLDVARERAEAFRALPEVAGVGGVGSLMPADAAEKRQLAADVRDSLEPALSEAVASTNVITSESTNAGASYDQLMTQLRAMQFALSAVSQNEQPEVVRDAIGHVRSELGDSIALFTEMSPEQQVTAVGWAGTHYRGWRAMLVLQLASLVDPSPLEPSDLPDALDEHWRIGKQGRYALEIYPSLPEDKAHDFDAYLAPDRLAAFAQQVRSVDPEATGTMLQIYNSGVMMRESYQRAGILALIAVLVLVTFDFRSLYDAILTLVPVALGFGVTFAIMRAVGQNINPANIMVLPLMFGIGVDAGVHALHRYRQHPNEQPPGLTHGTGKGITITSLTTMIGFGVMLFASHRGIASLGFVLTVGVFMTLIACLTVMPAWLELRNRYARKKAEAAAAE